MYILRESTFSRNVMFTSQDVLRKSEKSPNCNLLITINNLSPPTRTRPPDAIHVAALYLVE